MHFLASFQASLSLYIPYLVSLITAMCMAKNGRQMMSHLLKATPLLHTVTSPESFGHSETFDDIQIFALEMFD